MILSDVILYFLDPVQQDAGPLIDSNVEFLDLEEYSEEVVEENGFTRISFVPPVRLDLIPRQVADYWVDLDFGTNMRIDSDFSDPTNYAIAPEGPGTYPVSVVGVTVFSAREVRLTITLGTNGKPYRVTIVGDVKLDSGESVRGRSGYYLGEVNPPFIRRIEAISEARIRVTFTRDMANNADLVDPGKYEFTNGLVAIGVSRTGLDTVEVTTSRQLEGVSYTLRVYP